MFTFRLPAVGEAAFKWQVTFNFEARLLAICTGLFLCRAILAGEIE